MSSTLSVAVAQSAVTTDIAANGAHIRELIERAAQNGADLILFAEGALSGYAKSQITSWDSYDWSALRNELVQIGKHCATHGIAVIVGSAHPLDQGEMPHNSLFAISADGVLQARYDKRLLSHTEINRFYTPGLEPVIFDIRGFRFGFSLCIEAQFPETFIAYEQLGTDCILHASYGLGSTGEILLRAHAAANCQWICVASPANRVGEGASGIIGPDGNWIVRCGDATGIALAVIDRDDPRFDIALNKARPWRRTARSGQIYTDRRSASPRSIDRSRF